MIPQASRGAVSALTVSVGRLLPATRIKSPVPPSTDPVLSKDPALRARLSGRKARTEAETGKTTPPLTTTPLTAAKKVTAAAAVTTATHHAVKKHVKHAKHHKARHKSKH